MTQLLIFLLQLITMTNLLGIVGSTRSNLDNLTTIDLHPQAIERTIVESNN